VPAEQKAHVQLKPRTPFKPQAFRAAIESAGQQVRAFELVLCAAVEVRQGRYYLQPGGVTQRFAAAGPETARKLQGLIGKPVCVRGTLVSDHPPLALELREIAALGPEANPPSAR
jgi:hypothetical protein